MWQPNEIRKCCQFKQQPLREEIFRRMGGLRNHDIPCRKIRLPLVLTRLSYEETENRTCVYFKHLLIKGNKGQQSQGISQSYDTMLNAAFPIMKKFPIKRFYVKEGQKFQFCHPSSQIWSNFAQMFLLINKSGQNFFT